MVSNVSHFFYLFTFNSFKMLTEKVLVISLGNAAVERPNDDDDEDEIPRHLRMSEFRTRHNGFSITPTIIASTNACFSLLIALL